MKKLFLIIGILLVSAAAFGQAELAYMQSPYWIVGRLQDVPTAVADGRQVVFYKDDAALAAGRYAQGVVENNRFMLNAFGVWPDTITTGDTYNVATVRTTDNYGANGTVTISGAGWDEVANFALVVGGGIAPPGDMTQEPVPEVRIWFGDRIYQKVLVAQGETQVISDQPDIRVEFSIDEPYTLSANVSDYSVIVDDNTPTSQTLKLAESDITARTYISGTSAAENKLSSLTFSYPMQDSLSDGAHVFSFSARSSGILAAPSSVTELATVEVMGGPLRVIGPVVVFPTPFSISKNGTCDIQYQLSTDGAVEVYIMAVGGVFVKKWSLEGGQPGGSAGYNKVSWNGVTDAGLRAGNAVYVGTIVSKDDGRLLAKFKFAVMD